MPANEPFTGFYSNALRKTGRCLTDEEFRMFVTVALYGGPNGMARPGVRELHDATGYHTKLVSELLKSLQQKDLVMVLRQNERDPLTQQMLADVYVVNPAIVLVSDPSLWQENRFRHASMPESTFPRETAQAEQSRISEAESLSRNSEADSPEGAAVLLPDPVATQNGVPPDTSSSHAGPTSAAGSANAPNSRAARNAPSPGSGAPPSHNLSFTDKMAVEAIRRQVPDMSHEKGAELVSRYGIDQFTAAFLRMKERQKRVPIKRPTGWIIRNLELGAKR